MSITFPTGEVWHADPVADNAGGTDVDPMCFESYLCQHYVSVNGQPSRRMGGLRIAQLFQARNLPVPSHFAGYLKHATGTGVETQKKKPAKTAPAK